MNIDVDVQDHQNHPAPTPRDLESGTGRGTGHQSIPSNSTVTTVNGSMVPLKLEDTNATMPHNNGVDLSSGDDTDDYVPAPIARIPTILQPSLPRRERLMHFTFAWYTVT